MRFLRPLPSHNPPISIINLKSCSLKLFGLPWALTNFRSYLSKILVGAILISADAMYRPGHAVPAMAEGQMVAVSGRVVVADDLCIAGLVAHAVATESVEGLLRIRVDGGLALVAVDAEADDYADGEVEAVGQSSWAL